MNTPIAACCLMALMIGAVKTHIALKVPIVAPAVLAVLPLVTALGRAGVIGS